jgi:alkylation response protein AidB-like acyl-CoA dehydrogenase
MISDYAFFDDTGIYYSFFNASDRGLDMNQYRPAPADARFILLDVLKAAETIEALPALAWAADTGLIGQVLEEASKFVGGVVAPLSRTGDEAGCTFRDGHVLMPAGARDAYQSFWRAGWASLACAEEDGGQGLPAALEMILYEWLSGANHGWTMAPGLLHGAYECIRHHGAPDIKQIYLPKIATGEWLATMCLTEAQAGSDLGLVTDQATPDADGRYRINGTKIFISGGEHDLTDNIVHLVLARIPGSPPGTRGLSLFLAPKFQPDGARNPVHCERIEEKMGIHASPTCVMRFDDAPASLIGEAGKGLQAMFVMMNAARLHVAMQGLGLLDAAWQKAHDYALERRQMRAPGPRDASQEADPIIRHPAVKRLLDTQRAWIDGGRVLAYRTALELDVARHHPDPERRAAAALWSALVTPVLKAAWTEQAFHGASDCLQVFGGHGYLREWGIEQIVRDARIAMIYEGTNEIQAIDLLFRKVLADRGRGITTVLEGMYSDTGDIASAPALRARAAIDELRELVQVLAVADAEAAQRLHPVAGDFLRAFALTLLAWAWARLAATGEVRVEDGNRAFARWVQPELAMRRAMVHTALERPEP